MPAKILDNIAVVESATFVGELGYSGEAINALQAQGITQRPR